MAPLRDDSLARGQKPPRPFHKSGSGAESGPLVLGAEVEEEHQPDRDARHDERAEGQPQMSAAALRARETVREAGRERQL